MAVTVQKIADRVGLSRPTVSHILSGRAHAYNPETCRQVREVAEAMGYRPNAAARVMRSGRFGSIGLLLSTRIEHSRLFEGLLTGMRHEARQRDLHLTVGDLPDEEISEGTLPKILREWSVDGLLINYTHRIPPGLVQQVQLQGVPNVWINAQMPANCVHPDDSGAARIGAKMLIDAGHKRTAFVLFRPGGSAPDLQHYSIGDRAGGYREAVTAAGLTPRQAIFDDEIDMDSLIEETRALLVGPKAPTGLLFYSSTDAARMIAAAQALGLRVPADFSVVTFSEDQDPVIGFEMTRLCLPAFELGRAAVEMLCGRIQHGTRTLPVRAVPLILKPGATVTPPRRASRRTSRQ